MTVLKILCIP